MGKFSSNAVEYEPIPKVVGIDKIAFGDEAQCYDVLWVAIRFVTKHYNMFHEFTFLGCIVGFAKSMLSLPDYF